MALGAGSRLGPYEIVAPLGAGGMGEVYKAHDTRLDRTVAIKVLASPLSEDPQFRERFDREAHAIASLNHAHICTLYDVGDAPNPERPTDVVHFLVMEHLEGETLAARLVKGALPLDQVLRYAIEIAEALDKAHHAGIVHRDLKPANVMLTKNGAKLLDFGLAKAAVLGVAAGHSALPTTPAHLTERGAILGTFQYMAPEQLEGRDADVRTDIFAFGAVVYEMATGIRAFEGTSQASLIAAILDREPPPLAATQPLLPAALEHVVRLCVVKDPDGRWQSAGDIVRELTWIASGGTATATLSPASTRRPRVRWLAAGVLVGLVAAGGALAPLMSGRTGSRSADVTRSILDLSPVDRLIGVFAGVSSQPVRTEIALSPDGRTLVFSGARGDHQQLYLRSFDALDAVPIAGTEGSSSPVFSPDGKWIAFLKPGELQKVALAGGPPITVCRLLEEPVGGSWGEDGRIVLGSTLRGLWDVPASGGVAQPLTTLDTSRGEVGHRLPYALPGGDAIVFTAIHNRFPRWSETRLMVYSRRARTTKLLIEGGADARYVSSGHLAYVREGTLMAAPFDLGRLQVTGASVALLSGVMQAANAPDTPSDSGAAQMAVSPGGILAYAPGGVVRETERVLVWLDRTGRVTPLAIPPRAYAQPRLSPDDRRITFSTQQAEQDVWIFDLARGTLTRLTTEGRNASPIWTVDGAKVVYRSSLTGPDRLVGRSSDGAGAAAPVLASQWNLVPGAWSPDGHTLAAYAVRTIPGNSNSKILMVPLDGENRPAPLLDSEFFEAGIDFSPDGRWVAYATNASKRSEVYVQAFDGGGSRRQISINGGMSPVWRRDGHELYFLESARASGLSDIRVMAVPIETAPGLTIGMPRPLFSGRYVVNQPARGYDVTRDGQRFLLLQQKETPPLVVRQLVLVQNWMEELRRRVPSK